MKATVSAYSLSTWTTVTVPLAEVLAQVSKIERKTFHRNEAMSFESELQKRNFELALVVEDMRDESRLDLLAYVAIARTKGKALLHKVCVLENFRRRGIATRILQMQLEKLKVQGCETVQLWVDESKEPAKHLYKQLGFVEIQTLEHYYAPGRTGIKMELRLI